MKKGKELLEFISNILLIIVFIIMIVGIFIPRGGGLPIMVGAMMLFFVYPIIEGLLILYHRWLYRNIILGEGWLNEGLDTWEWFKVHIIDVIPFKKLPKMLHDSYMNNIDTYYIRQIKDKTLEELNKRFSITEKLDVSPLKPIDYNEVKILEDKQRIPIGYDSEDEDDNNYNNNESINLEENEDDRNS